MRSHSYKKIYVLTFKPTLFGTIFGHKRLQSKKKVHNKGKVFNRQSGNHTAIFLSYEIHVCTYELKLVKTDSKIVKIDIFVEI